MFLKSCGNYLLRGCFPCGVCKRLQIVTIADHQEHSNAASTNDQATGSVAHNMLLIPGKCRRFQFGSTIGIKHMKPDGRKRAQPVVQGNQPRSVPVLGCVMQLDDATGALLVGVHHASIKGA